MGLEFGKKSMGLPRNSNAILQAVQLLLRRLLQVVAKDVEAVKVPTLASQSPHLRQRGKEGVLLINKTWDTYK